MKTTSKHHGLARAALRLLDLAGGTLASLAALMAGMILWAFLTGDAGGGEPFAATVFGSIRLVPLFLCILIMGPVAWWHCRTLKGRAKTFGYQVLATVAVFVLSWLIRDW